MCQEITGKITTKLDVVYSHWTTCVDALIINSVLRLSMIRLLASLILPLKMSIDLLDAHHEE